MSISEAEFAVLRERMAANYRGYLAEGSGCTAFVEQPKPRRGRMNKWEAAYAAHLDSMKPLDVIWYGFEAFKLRLADGAWFTPDFTVLLWRTKAGETTARLEFHEVKGHWREAARVRIKVAADKYPFMFLAVTKDKKTGEWQYERIRGRA